MGYNETPIEIIPEPTWALSHLSSSTINQVSVNRVVVFYGLPNPLTDFTNFTNVNPANVKSNLTTANKSKC